MQGVEAINKSESQVRKNLKKHGHSTNYRAHTGPGDALNFLCVSTEQFHPMQQDFMDRSDSRFMQVYFFHSVG